MIGRSRGIWQSKWHHLIQKLWSLLITNKQDFPNLESQSDLIGLRVRKRWQRSRNSFNNDPRWLISAWKSHPVRLNSEMPTGWINVILHVFWKFSLKLPGRSWTIVNDEDYWDINTLTHKGKRIHNDNIIGRNSCHSYHPWNKSLRHPYSLDRNNPRSVLMDFRERKSHRSIQFLPPHPEWVSIALPLTSERGRPRP
jgi:hypothetical protein